MLKKLLGYDFKYVLKFLLIFYGLAMFFAILTRLFRSFESSLLLSIIAEICTGAAISMVCSSLINNIMRLWVRFKSNLYGDESYLSHTLPVKKSTHYFSKIITGVVSLSITFAVIAAVFFVGYYSKENILFLKNLLLPIAKLYDSTIIGVLTVLLGILFLEFVNILQCGFTGIILGHRMNNAKTGFSVLFGFVAFGISQLVMLAVLGCAALFNAEIMNLFVTEAVVDIQTLKTVAVTAAAVYGAVCIVFCFLNIKLFKKGVNVD